MKKHKNMKPLKTNGNINRFTVSLDDDTTEKLVALARTEDRKAAAMIAVLTKRKLMEITNG